MSGAGKPGAVRRMAAGLGVPVWGKEGLGPGASGCICPKSLVRPHLWALLPSSAFFKGYNGLPIAASNGQFSSSSSMA